MRIFIALFIALAGCTSALKSSDAHRDTLLVVEGLGYGDYVTHGLVEPLQKKHDFNFVRISWGSECPELPGQVFYAVGHSLGGPRVLECVAASGKTFELVVTLDPRVLGQPYRAPPNARKVINYRQTSLIFPGYPVEGAVEYIVNRGHTELPFMPEVHRDILEAMKSGPSVAR